MSEVRTFLKSIHVKNFRSLRDVTLPLKPLTVLVGPNASGKSNVLRALVMLKAMIIDEKLPPTSKIQTLLWAGGANHINFQLHTQVGKIPTEYQLELKAEPDNPFTAEELLVDDVKVISIQGEEGIVQDENGKNATRYRSNELALRSAGNYGDKPVTNALTEFMKGWAVYDFRPDRIRQDFEEFPFDPDGIAFWVSHWHKNDLDRFNNMSESLAASTNFRIDQHTIYGKDWLYLLEEDKNPIPLVEASDGTLRLIAYYTMLYKRNFPPLIAIEEPERSLHPGALKDITKILEQMADRSQVIITTHSSQLLDAFSSESLSDSLGVLFLRNVPGHGTKITNLEDILEDEVALNGWITDFGIGSAIFDSGLINPTEEEPVCQP